MTNTVLYLLFFLHVLAIGTALCMLSTLALICIEPTIIDHEKAHARKAFEAGLKEVLIVTSFSVKRAASLKKKIKGDKIKNDDQKLYFVDMPHKDYKKLFKGSRGICIYNSNDLTFEQRQEITQAGPNESKKRNRSLFNILIPFVFYWIYSIEVAHTKTIETPVGLWLTSAACFMAGVIAMLLVDLTAFRGPVLTKKEIDNWLKAVKAAKEGEYFYASLSDEAKLCHSEEYKRGLDILKAKGVKTYTVEERIKQIKEMGYEIKEL